MEFPHLKIQGGSWVKKFRLLFHGAAQYAPGSFNKKFSRALPIQSFPGAAHRLGNKPDALLFSPGPFSRMTGVIFHFHSFAIIPSRQARPPAGFLL
jgi:hypothetical protein